MAHSSAITPDQFTTFGELLKYLRHRAGLSQRELSIALGYSEGQISRLEHNQRAPDAAVIAARFVPELDLEKEKEWVARLLELATASHGEVELPSQEEEAETLHHNLPTRLTSFVARETELAEIAARLENPDCRLLTLVGAGGIGKTRLALEAVSDQVDVFRDGVFFVPLAPLNAGQPELIPATIANAIGFAFVGANTQQHQLVEYLRAKHMLLLLDNFEHVLEGRDLVLEIIRHAPQIQVIVTSRASLNVQPEWLLHISGLSCPPTVTPGRDEVLASGAARLFLDRAGQVNEHFTLNAETTLALARLCLSVEGMPLALELAAAQTRTLPLEEIAAQVSSSFDTLQTNMHDVQARHRSLGAVLDWSYKLLSEEERALFRSLAVFAGGWTLDAAEAVGGGTNVVAADIPTRLNDLVDKSLVVVEQAHGKARYRMLEPVHQYAETKLKAMGEEDTARRRHLEFYLPLSELDSDGFQASLENIETELENLRAATTWCRHGEVAADVQLRMASVVAGYCSLRGYLSEARNWLEDALARTDEGNAPRERAEATRRLADALAYQGEFAKAESQFLICMRLYHELGRVKQYAWALGRLGWLAREQGDGATARTRIEASLALSREYQDESGNASQLITLGEVFVMLEEGEKARKVIEEGMASARSLGDMGILYLAWGNNHLAHVAQLEGDWNRARRLHEQSLPVFRSGMQLGIAWAEQGMGETWLAEQDAKTATIHLERALVLFQKMGDRMGVSWCLAGLAGVAVLNVEPERAALLWGAAEHLRQFLGVRTAPAARATHERLMTQLRRQMGEQAFATAWAKGEHTPLEEVLNEILSP